MELDITYKVSKREKEPRREERGREKLGEKSGEGKGKNLGVRQPMELSQQRFRSCLFILNGLQKKLFRFSKATSLFPKWWY